LATSIYEYSQNSITGDAQSLADYEGKVVLIVNTASQCGLTPHYKGLQRLYDDYQDKGLVVLGFPCNQFGGQEPGSEEEIQQFCASKFNVTFPMFSKIDVNGEHAHPLYRYLKKELGGDENANLVTWNFTKFLVDRAGKPHKHFEPTTSPKDLIEEIESLL
jgi:glutathione peroxidase